MTFWKLCFSYIVVLVLTFFALHIVDCELSEDTFRIKNKLSFNEKERKTKREQESKSSDEQSKLENQEREKKQSSCFPPINCVYAAYRSIDGTCNNLDFPYWGASGTPYERFMIPEYEDGVSTPRGHGRSIPLPKPRTVSVGMNSVSSSVPDAITLTVMQWGQFVDHDLVSTLEDSDPQCCSNFFNLAQTSSSCFPLNVTDDPFYKSFNVKCLPFVRSTASSCAGSPREQINRATSYLDGSQIYGSNAAQLNAVREPNSYRLKIGPGNENPQCSGVIDPFHCPFTFLPIRKNSASGNDEFIAGDGRVEEQPGLTSMHTIFVRLHNDLADVIWFYNDHFSINTVFEEARMIVIAILQQITYNEFLPIILGKAAMIKYGLKLKDLNATDPYFRGYNKTENAMARSAFSTASYRFGHSLIKDKFVTKPTNIEVPLAKNFNNHKITLNNSTYPSHFLRGICSAQSEEMDHRIVDAVHNKLFAAPPSFSFGSDLYARNIMRGRDHGLPPYTAWVDYCELDPVTKFSDLSRYMPSAVIDKLNTLYGGLVHEIDLFNAGIAEVNMADDTLLGRTFVCLNAKQFHLIKYGDSFWFEKSDMFSKYQLGSIRNTTLATLFCFYLQGDSIQANVFLPEGPKNPSIKCSELLRYGVLNDISLYWQYK